MKVVILSVSVPDICLPDEVVPVINRALESSYVIPGHEGFFVRILDAYLIHGILERKPNIPVERPQRKKKAS